MKLVAFSLLGALLLTGCNSVQPTAAGSNPNENLIGSWKFDHVRGTAFLTLHEDGKYEFENHTCISDSAWVANFSGTYTLPGGRAIKMTAESFSWVPEGSKEPTKLTAVERSKAIAEANAKPPIQFLLMGDDLTTVDPVQGKVVWKRMKVAKKATS